MAGRTQRRRHGADHSGAFRRHGANGCVFGKCGDDSQRFRIGFLAADHNFPWRFLLENRFQTKAKKGWPTERRDHKRNRFCFARRGGA